MVSYLWRPIHLLLICFQSIFMARYLNTPLLCRSWPGTTRTLTKFGTQNTSVAIKNYVWLMRAKLYLWAISLLSATVILNVLFYSAFPEAARFPRDPLLIRHWPLKVLWSRLARKCFFYYCLVNRVIYVLSTVMDSPCADESIVICPCYACSSLSTSSVGGLFVCWSLLKGFRARQQSNSAVFRQFRKTWQYVVGRGQSTKKFVKGNRQTDVIGIIIARTSFHLALLNHPLVPAFVLAQVRHVFLSSSFLCVLRDSFFICGRYCTLRGF